MTYRWIAVSGTGHRKMQLGGDCDWVAAELPRACDWLKREVGTEIGISGLALEFDMDWAEAVLDAGLKLWVAIPFEGQPARWPKAQQQRWRTLRAAAHRERVIGAVPDDLEPRARSAVVNTLLRRRNLHMLTRSNAVITGWEPGRFDGGTAEALREAANRKLPGIHLDPVARRPRFHLPSRVHLDGFALYHTGCRHTTLIATRPAVDARHEQLAAAGHHDWRVRPSRPREARDDGCDTCIAELAAAAEHTPVLA